jgi:TolB protein
MQRQLPGHTRRTNPEARWTTKAAILLSAVAGTGVLSVATPSDAQSTESTQPNHALVDKIVVSSDRHTPTLPPQLNNGEIYLLDLCTLPVGDPTFSTCSETIDGSGEQRLTHNSVFDGFGSLSPDGKKIVFDSNRNRNGSEPDNTSDLFLMNADGSDQTFLAHGGSPTWSPDGKYIAFHASADGTGLPINDLPGAATTNSDIFVANVDDLELGTPPRNLTNDPQHVDDDPDWSPDGTMIAYTSHDIGDPTKAEVYVRSADGTGTPKQLTFTTEEERAPNWSHRGDRISYMCHASGLVTSDFEICVMASNGTNQHQLTDNDVGDLTPAWSANDDRIVFHRPQRGRGNQLWWVTTSDGTPTERILVPSTEPTGSTLFADIGVLRVKADR